MTGIPLINVNNNCSSGSSALFLARQAVASGAVDVALAFGFEQMQRGALVEQWADRTSPVARALDRHDALHGTDPPTRWPLRFSAGLASPTWREYGTSASTFARIAVKARQARSEQPLRRLHQPVTMEEVMTLRLSTDR